MLKVIGPRSSPAIAGALPLTVGHVPLSIRSSGARNGRLEPSDVPTWPENAVLAALWLAFAGLPVRAFGAENELARNVGRLFIDIGGMGLVSVGLFSLSRVASAGLARGYVSTYVFLATCVLAAGTGLVRGNAFLLWLVMGLLPFASALVVFAIPHDGRFGGRVLNLLMWQTVLGVILATYVILFEAIPSRAVWNGPNGDGIGKMATRCLYATPFLLACLSRLKQWQVLLAVTAWLELAVLGVLGASRGIMTVTFLLIPVFLYVVSVRARAKIGRIVGPFMVACVLLASAIGVAGSTGRWPDFGPYLQDRWEQAVGRLTGNAPEDLTFDLASSGTVDSAKREFLEGSSRGGELEDFLSQMQTFDYIFGRGFGGTWFSTYWGQEWLIVHIGPGHLLLVGGVPLLLSFSWVLLSATLAAWRRLADDPIAAGVFLYVVVFVQNFLQHGAIQDEIEVFFFWVCVGLAFVSRRSPAVSKPLLLRQYPGRHRVVAT